MIRVLIVEDSPTVAAFLDAVLSADPEVEVVGTARDGRQGVDMARRLEPDVITMDIHMPVMDGLEATRTIMAEHPHPIVIVTGSAQRRDVDMSFDALDAGALTILEKPGPADQSGLPQFVRTVKAMSQVAVVRRRAGLVPPHRPAGPGISLVAVAASTGGPAAVRQVLTGLGPDFPVPVLIVQHLARGFLPGLVDWLASQSGFRVEVAQDGSTPLPGVAYLAPDDIHLAVARDGRLTQRAAPPVGGHRPSADVLFASAADAHGAGLVAVVLTGMGMDGRDGARAVQTRGGRVLAQDESSSVVFGMPGAVTRAGLSHAVLPPADIAAWLVQAACRKEATWAAGC